LITVLTYIAAELCAG